MPNAFPEFAGLLDQVKKSTAAREKDRPSPLENLSIFFETDANPPVHHVLKRGQHNQPGDEVQPGVPNAFVSTNNVYRFARSNVCRARSAPDGGLAFARWLTSPENPLFARVMVNRIWQHHFGAGLSATPDNLGLSGARPSHPELLDFLADEFVKSGWSVKAMHRLIRFVPPSTSSRVRRASRILKVWTRTTDLLGPISITASSTRRRLRDAFLSVAGDLDTRVGGPDVPSRRAKDGTVEVAENQDGAKRRSVYMQQRRTQVMTLLQLFDAPTIVGNCSTRTTSTVPLQSLALLNSQFVRDRAKSLEQRLKKEAGGDSAARLTLAFRLACGRAPDAEETAAAERFLVAQRKVYGDGQG